MNIIIVNVSHYCKLNIFDKGAKVGVELEAFIVAPGNVPQL